MPKLGEHYFRDRSFASIHIYSRIIDPEVRMTKRELKDVAAYACFAAEVLLAELDNREYIDGAMPEGSGE